MTEHRVLLVLLDLKDFLALTVLKEHKEQKVLQVLRDQREQPLRILYQEILVKEGSKVF